MFSKKHLILWDNDDFALRYVAKGILSGVRIWHRLTSVYKGITFLVKFKEYVEEISPPSILLMIVHGKNGHFVRRSHEGTEELLPVDWFDLGEACHKQKHRSKPIGLIAYGCNSIDCFEQYDLGERVRWYVGTSGDLDFYIGSWAAQRRVRRVLKRVGRAAFRAGSYLTSNRERQVEMILSDLRMAYEADLIWCRHSGEERLNNIFFENHIQRFEGRVGLG